MPDKKKKTSKGQLGEATKLGDTSREFLPDLSEEDLDAKQAAISTRRRRGGPELVTSDEDNDEEENTARGFFPETGVPPTELEEP